MRNWLTTLGGILLSLGALAETLDLPADWKWVSPALLSIGGLIVGAGAKQFNVHSTVEEVKTATVKKDLKR